MQLATLCYIDNGTSYLLLHRHKKKHDVHQGKWIGVGGKVERGETPEECIKREVLEETGLVLNNPKLNGVITFPNFDGVKDWYVFVFTATTFSGNLIESDEGSLEWVPYEKVREKPTWEGDLLFLDWLLNKKPFFSAKMEYNNGRLAHHHVLFYE
ncbi:NUDIX domain-containing protein [Granulicatella sp. zg-ZJ]|uniref:NUDIX hydrolase n=1 Tax=unclassified Granulicatella TaxID=2630493 RepID=UPI0013C29265|nr:MULTISPECIES: 8-oxo-dGTP diphosphatase [unclassified Granulicatella]MBS4749856.1 8-oxo-dGTP diphosphatase [Carnobacteriaceae bacterium zg-ZUI78]NEW63042.1 NUDIX domain-containing protein [Granulicatella sp. zg-ZJ]NEW66205.1 NUDIX domain-containing protein [Granulicatella sp. zg-84]QMI85950.1 8-oxo-dGTP diphosphatase [Carnobacteriaceae bacterium zg-84]